MQGLLYQLFNESTVVACRGVTVEYQRQRAKEMRQYFVDLRTEELRGKSQ
jgi:hypothetical protein